jgi:hypothetical protein
VVGGPTPAEPRVLEVTVLGGSNRSNPAAVDTMMVEKAAADKEAAEAAVTPPSRNDGANQDHVEGFSVKQEFTSTCIQAIIIVF